MQRVLLCSPDYLATVDVDPASDTYQQASLDAWQTATTQAAAAAAPPAMACALANSDNACSAMAAAQHPER